MSEARRANRNCSGLVPHGGSERSGGPGMRVTKGLLAALAGLCLALAPTAPAWAHATLQKSDPADGSTVDKPITQLTLTFNEAVKQQFTTITVTGSGESSYAVGDPR